MLHYIRKYILSVTGALHLPPTTKPFFTLPADDRERSILISTYTRHKMAQINTEPIIQDCK